MTTAFGLYINAIQKSQNCGLWEIRSSSLGGRGLFAIKEIPENTELFREAALLIGPRAGTLFKEVCVNCHKPGRLKVCPTGCGLLVCEGLCLESLHRECEVLKRLPNGLANRVAAVAPLRAVFLNDDKRSILRSLERHERKEHSEILESLKNVLCEEDVAIVKTCCEVLDATAFETPCGTTVSLRGIYPLGALLNHDCSPNTRHFFDSDGKMVLVTTRVIAAGEEFTNSYTSLTWGTKARSNLLQATKNFTCQCQRCRDPSEFGSCLMALYCMKKNCGGSLLPNNLETGDWKCLKCKTIMAPMRMQIIQKMVRTSVSSLNSNSPKEGCRLLRKNCLVPSSNHFAVQFKLSLISLYGSNGSFKWSDLRNEDLILKDLLCAELLILCTILKLGLCRLRGILLLELVKTLTELEKRNIFHYYSQILLPFKSIPEIKHEAERILGKIEKQENGDYTY